MSLEHVVLKDYLLAEKVDVDEKRYFGFVHESEHYIFDAEDLFKNKPLPIAGRDMRFGSFVYKLMSYDPKTLEATCEKITDTLEVQRLCYTYFKEYQPTTKQVLEFAEAMKFLEGGK